MSQHISKAQEGIRKNNRGSKNQLMVNRAVIQDSKTRQTKLSTTWIDYKKVYNNLALITFIKNSVQFWKTTLEANSTKSHHQVRHIPW